MQKKLEKKVTAITPLPNVPTTFTESEKAKNKNCYQELFEDVEAKGGRTVKKRKILDLKK